MQALTGTAPAGTLPKREAADAARRDAVATEIQPPSNSAASASTEVVSALADTASSGTAARRGRDESTKEQSREDVEEAVSGINDFFKSVERSMEFSLDEEGDRMVVKIKDSNGEVVKQIPSEQALELARRLDEVKGLLLEEQA
ncbi:flagellar protein FlaG [Thiocystis violacea]|uniref:flagellar protein FlaG n=1 Tax=Thiocystis violacea TaxID=13725 RepID=UPI0019072E81|nr:flagellar protein FlaG [Thiocystis violacea]MBK1722643.1 hypothetical protein [Thiocystis violacea]